MSGFEALKFFATAPHPCSYLDGQEATTLFVEPNTPLSAEQVVKLAESGFRRSGRYIYRPHCSQCSACISVRVPVASYQPKRRQIRTRKQNRDVTFNARSPILDEEHYELYRRYIEVRHADGDMYPPSPAPKFGERILAKLLSNTLKLKLVDNALTNTTVIGCTSGTSFRKKLERRMVTTK